MIGYFEGLEAYQKEAVFALLERDTMRIKVLDHWEDDHAYMLLVKAIPWAIDPVHFIVGHLTMEQAAAFHYGSCGMGRKIMRDYLKASTT